MAIDPPRHPFSRYLPRLGLASLILCLASGIILSFHYRPMGDVFRNVEEITTLVPFGRFFRQLHYASGELFVILMLLHTLDHFLKRRYGSFAPIQWVFLLVSLGLCFFALFTGFVLKGDKEGLFAGEILMHILRTIPVAGNRLSNMFIEPGKSLLFLPYLYHCLFIPALILFFLRDHIREWFPDRSFLFVATFGLFLYALFIRPAPAIPPDAPVHVVEGPWFFLGLQSLLKVIQPFWAGIVIPALFSMGLFVLPYGGRRLSPWIHYILLCALSVYAVLTVRALMVGP